MKSHEDLIKQDIEWHAKNPQEAPSPEFAAGFVAGLRQALQCCEKFPDWEDVAEKLMDSMTIQNTVFDSMPTDLEDMISAEESQRVDDAYEAYNSAHKQVTS